MKKINVAALCLAIFISTGYTHEIHLTGTIRDFSVNHIDFENAVTGLQTGCIENTIAPSGVPIPVPGNACAISRLEDWYSNTHPGNLYTDHTIILNNGQSEPGGIYRFESDDFFPIDNRLGGNEGYPHNYHFTFELRFNFIYEPGQSFNFCGDDDVWVFIDEQLVMDLGGVHGQECGQVTASDLAALGLQAGQVYPFDLFFAERHTNSSNFHIEMEIYPMSLQFPMDYKTHILEPGFGYEDYIHQWYNCEDTIDDGDENKPQKYHAGIDVIHANSVSNPCTATARKPVYAVGDGQIVALWPNSYPGDRLILKLDELACTMEDGTLGNVYAFYGHIDTDYFLKTQCVGFPGKCDPTEDKLNCKCPIPINVGKGEQLGKVGNYRNLNTHLHFEMRCAEDVDFFVDEKCGYSRKEEVKEWCDTGGYTTPLPSKEGSYLDPCLFLKQGGAQVPSSCEVGKVKAGVYQATTYAEIPVYDADITLYSPEWPLPIRRKPPLNDWEVGVLMPEGTLQAFAFKETPLMMSGLAITNLTGYQPSNLYINVAKDFLLKASQNGQCVEVENASPTTGANFQLGNCNGLEHQRFRLREEGRSDEGRVLVSLQAIHSKQCMTVPIYFGEQFIMQKKCEGYILEAQQFEVVSPNRLSNNEANLSEINLRSAVDEYGNQPYCVAISNESDRSNIPLVIEPCDSSSINQRFDFAQVVNEVHCDDGVCLESDDIKADKVK